ncbi:MAG TPA: response regulator transcription factor [Anaerolineae bacterium]|nr:response regulator transcription factor [Anaerolineae bacterium]
MINLFIVHPARLITSLMGSVLTEEADIFVVGKAHSIQGALERLPQTPCNMLVVAASLPDNGALKLTKIVQEQYKEIKVLVIGLPDRQKLILEYVMAGIDGYVLQDVPMERLLHHLRAAHDDAALISPQIAAALMKQISDLAQVTSQYELNPDLIESLTPREREVLTLIGDDLTNQEIADKLFIELGTVKNHVHNILKKLDVDNRHDAANYLPLLEDDKNSPEQ